VLAAVAFLIRAELVHVTGMRAIRAERPVEFRVALFTAAAVVLVGVEEGVLLAVALSLLVHRRHGYRMQNTVLVEPAGRLRPVPVTRPAQALPGLVPYRLTA
jgi:MFS superfamily sulfate permease-like transporter